MLFPIAGLRPGNSVLVHMAAGGVGIAVLQLCRTVENVTTYGTSSPGKHEMIRAQGCDHPIDYRSLDYAEEVRKLTNGRGVDIVLDALGGDDWKKGYELLTPAGKLVAFGFANMATGNKRNLFTVVRQFLSIPKWSPMNLMDTNRLVAGVNMGHLWGEVEMLRVEMEALLELYRQGKIKPHVDTTFSFDAAGEAHQYIHDRKNVGKVILVP
jgi:synaptic vesicle membrane protein VAT-1